MKHKDCWYKKILEFLFIDSECLLSLKSTKSGWQVGGSKEGRFCSCWLFGIAAVWILGKNNHTASLCMMKTKASFVATWWIGRRKQCVKWTKADTDMHKYADIGWFLLHEESIRVGVIRDEGRLVIVRAYDHGKAGGMREVGQPGSNDCQGE